MDRKKLKQIARELIIKNLEGSLANDLFDIKTFSVAIFDDGAYGINEGCEILVNVDFKNDTAKEIAKTLNYLEDSDRAINVDIYDEYVLFSISIYDDAEYVDENVIKSAVDWFTDCLKEKIERY